MSARMPSTMSRTCFSEALIAALSAPRLSMRAMGCSRLLHTYAEYVCKHEPKVKRTFFTYFLALPRGLRRGSLETRLSLSRIERDGAGRSVPQYLEYFGASPDVPHAASPNKSTHRDGATVSAYTRPRAGLQRQPSYWRVIDRSSDRLLDVNITTV